MASRNIVIKNNTRCFKSALLWSSDFSFLFLYILADLISFLEIQRLQPAGSSSTVFAVNLTLLHVPHIGFFVIQTKTRFCYMEDGWKVRMNICTAL